MNNRGKPPNENGRNNNVKDKIRIYSDKPQPNEMQYVPHQSSYNSSNHDGYNNAILSEYKQSLETINKLEVEKRKHQDEINEHNNNYRQLRALCDKYKDKITELTNKINNEINQHQKTATNLKEREQRLKRLEIQNNENKQQTQQLQQSLASKENQLHDSEKEKGELEAKNNNLLQNNTHLKNQLELLVQQNTLLENEASNYQSALGVATNFQLGDDDQNHAVKLNTDILELIDDIKKYVTNLKTDVTVNMDKVKKLLQNYKCSTKITNQKDDRLLIQAILQRHVIEKIFEYATQYFQSTGQHYYLESDIIKNESLLSLLLSHTSKCRTGNDEITRVGPTKLRQQIYSILSNRGFSDILGADNASYEHPFIAHYKGQLNNIINDLRYIKDAQKKTASDKLAARIIREVVKLFWFRLKVQEPVAEFCWIQNNNVYDKNLMEGNDLDDNVNSTVDLCYFPLIGRDLRSNNRKIHTLAKVVLKPPSRISTRLKN
ncbi:hypothetical protein C1645_789122 [Glomus cerebriforme]|uniref:Uncharacterized protein n=1 Tax=Glomus cerebriforme TaxID=658196 RepID=A0A397SH10_9GLOM|nr:hypothetical protein C1645_789122 [Glomus cerebriforme]